MNQPRFLADNDLNERIIDGVLRREPSIQFLRLRELGMADSDDCEVLEYASEHGLLLVSHDVNTMPGYAFDLMNDGKLLAGLIMIAQSKPIGSVIDDLVMIWSASDSEDWVNQVIFLPI